MAFAAARAVIRARKEREKLLARTKALTEKTLDSNQRKELVVSLRLNEASSYLANLVEGFQNQLILSLISPCRQRRLFVRLQANVEIVQIKSTNI